MKIPTAKMIGPGTRVAVYSDPVTRKHLIGMATIQKVRSIKTVYVDAGPMLEIFAEVVFGDGAPPRADGVVFKSKDVAELVSVYLKP
jgi:hypothetical protein